jgi:3',5'-cyclic-AMP phosphodiesterase
MQRSRKEFIKLSIGGIFVWSGANTLQAFSASRFWPPRPDQVKIRFALASDGHFGQSDTDFVRHHDNMVDWLNSEKKGRGLDFSVINGDLIHDDPHFLADAKKSWDRLKMPYYVSHGNHDVVDESSWIRTWNFPWNHSFDLEDSAFLILNTASETGQYTCPNINWVKERLDRFQKSKHLLIFMHITPFKWTKGGYECPELVELFNNQPNLRFIFHGHDHDQDNVLENKGKYYFFDSHIAGNWGTAYRGYRIVEMLKSGEIMTYQMNAAEGKKMNENLL